MGLFRASTSGPRPKAGRASNVRGRISGPIPMDDEFPIRNPGTGVAREGQPSEAQGRIDIPSTSVLGDYPDPDVAPPRAKTGSIAGVSNPSALQSRSNTRRSTMRYSTMSYGSTGHPRHERKPSSLRSALSRIFGRKKKDSTTSLQSPASPGPVPLEQHESDLSTPSGDMDGETDAERSASMAVTDFDRALRSHSIGPDDIIAIESARNSVQAEPNFSRRRATTTSGISSLRGRDTVADAFGLSPRPASAHGQGNNSHTLLAELEPDDIGRAVTSDVPDLLPPHKRRSRSVSQIRDADDALGPPRSRSDEINYWRASYDPAAHPPQRLSDGVESGDVVSSIGSPPDSRPVTSPQPTALAPPMAETRFLPPPASLEERIADLENRNDRLEKLVAQLLQTAPEVSYDQGLAGSAHTGGFTPSMGGAPRPSSRNSDGSFGDGITYVGSVSASARPINHRPLSNTTIRGATSLPSLPREMLGTTLTLDHYTFLKALLDTERAARRMLEDHVTKLTHRLSLLSTRTSALPDLNATPRSVAMYSTFEHDDDDDEDETGNAQNDEPYVANSEFNYSESEAFRTPVEGTEYSFDSTENDTDVDERARKRAMRTHSLGQLTQKVNRPAMGVDF